jgi:hypothetical protein
VETAETTEHARHTAQSARSDARRQASAESSRFKRTTVSASGIARCPITLSAVDHHNRLAFCLDTP